MKKGGKLAGWKVERLGSVCEIDKIPNRKKNLPYIGLEHIKSNTGKFIGSTEPLSVKSMTFNFSDKHVLYGRLRPYLKKVLLPDFEGHCSSEIFPLKVSSQLDRRFLFHWLLSDETTEKINATSTGARMPRANMNYVLDFEIPIPPLPEQQRIVSVLDDAFASIAQAKSNAERNLVNARELFETLLQDMFSDGEDWEQKTLGEITEVQSGGTPLRSIETYWNGNIPWYSSGELNNLYTEDPERKITKLGLDNSNAKIFPKGSLLMGMYDTAALKMSILDRDGTFNQAIAGAKPNSKIELKFVMYAIRVIKPEILNQRRGVRQKNLSLEKIKNIPILLPPLAEQRAIVGRLEALSAETGRLEEIYQQKVESLDELKKSVLGKAFEGEL